MKKNSDITSIIPVREGSSRIKEKIYLKLGEYTLLEHKINQLLKIQDRTKIVLSSNSENIKNIAKNFQIEYHERGDYLSVGHQASFSEVITGIVKDITTEHFAWITVVVPLMLTREYEEAFEVYRKQVIQAANYDSLVSVNLLKEYFWDDEKPINYRADKNHTISQELPNIYRVTNGLYMCSKVLTNEIGYFLGKNPIKFEVSKISGIDIDYPEDYEIAKALYPIFLSNEGSV
ncbi:MAG: acylneuraminate cytidylyltransferase family protein [Luteibaculaceae bacterium]